MFERIKSAFRGIIDELQGKLSERDIERFFEEHQLELIEADVSFEAIDYIRDYMLRRVKEGMKGDRGAVRQLLREAILSVVSRERPLEEIIASRQERPFVVTFLGINGTGKTTTVAKVAKRLARAGIRPLVVIADTYRTGAIEQMERLLDAIGIEHYEGRYGSDPASVAYDGVKKAASLGRPAVLIDTAGRMQTNEPLLDELAKIVSVSSSNYNVFVGDALSGNDIMQQARAFLEKPGFNSSIVTKVDADVKGGSIISLAVASRRPIMFLGVGQGYDDLVEFDPEWLLERVLP